MESANNTSGRVQCLNCNTPLQPDGMYCYHCGQGVKESRLSIMQVVKEALTNFFNLDGRFFQTLKDLYRPSKLTRTYVEGKRKFYMHPARLFIVSLILFISIAMSDLDLAHFKISGANSKERVELAKQKKKWDALMDSGLFAKDSLVLAAVADTMFGNINLDSLYIKDNGSIAGKSIGNYKIKLADAFALSSDEVLEKYKITGFGDRLYVKQYLKVLVNPSGGIRYVIKNGTWVVLILIFVMALFMKLFYIRSGRYYVEHLVLLMYGHSLVFISASLLLLLLLVIRQEDLGSNLVGALSVALIVAQYRSIKKYYGQGWFKTLVKMFLINSTYMIAAILIFTVGAIVSFVLF